MIPQPRRIQRAFLLCVLVLLLVGLFAPSHAASGGKVVLFLMDRVTLTDLMENNLPHIERLLEQGAVGLMNPLGVRGSGNMRLAMTINVGTRADADESAGEVLESDEIYAAENAPAFVVHRRRTGFAAQPGNLVNVHLREMMDSNLKSPHQVIIGTLGDLVHQAGGFTAALGNSDTGMGNWEMGQWGNVEARLRYGALIAMDSRGIVDRGKVSHDILQPHADTPYGVRIDTHKLFDEFRRLYADPQRALIVVDFGDIYRADVYSWLSAEEVALQHKQAALQRADALMGKIVRVLHRERDVLLVFSLSTPRLHAGEMLPVMAWGKGIKPKTYLTSGSTRRAGFITPTDITATVAQCLGATPGTNVLGRAVSTDIPPKPTLQRLQRLSQYNRLMVMTDRGLRFGVFVALALLETAVLLASAFVLTFPSLLSSRVKTVVCRWLVIVALLPFAIHFVNALVPLSFEMGWRSIGLALIWAACWMFLVRTGSKSCDSPLQILLSASGLVLMMSGLTTRFYTEFNTIFGYSSYFGGRYYGLGNATTSLLLGWGMANVGLACGKLSRRQLVLTALFLALITGVIAFPQAGADAGGAVGAVATFAPMWLVAKGVRLNGKKAGRAMAALFVILIVVIVLVSILDVRRPPEERSHLGRLVAEMQEQGIAPLVDMFVTKARVWGRTFGHWHWDVCLLAVALTTLWLLTGLRSRLVPLLAERPALNALLYGGIIGTVITFLLNDSGPLIACLMGLYVLSPPLYWMLKEETT